MSKTLARPEAPADLDAAIRRLPEMTRDELRAELTAALSFSARHLLYLAAVWAELEKKGEDLSDLRQGWWRYVPHIAAGAVLPETVAKFARQDTVLRLVAALTPEEQRRLTVGGPKGEGEPVPLVVRQGDSFTHRMLPAHALTATQARQVFGDRVIRTEAEQVAILTAASAKPPKPGKAPKRGVLRADREKGVIRVGHRSVPVADLVAALADLRGEQAEEPGDDAKTLVVRLSPAEHKRLAQRALDGDTAMTTLARDALRSAGLI